MQILVLLLILALFAHDAVPELTGQLLEPAGAWLAAVVLGPKLALAAAYWLLCRWGLSRLGRGRPQRTMFVVDRASDAYRLAAIGLFAFDLWAGALWWVRGITGNWILLDELVVLVPTLLMLVAGWAAYYPIERRLREAALIARLDAAGPVPALWTRGQYVLSQVRHQLALILVPLLLVLSWVQTVERFVPPGWLGLGFDARPVAIVAGVAVVFLLTPLIIRYVWDTVPLPDGPMRTRLEQMCKRHRVGVRELLLWRTFGGMINAAVMGLIAPLRYILLTDALLESMKREQVEAVMAHEIAHVRRHHMFWLMLTAVVSLIALEMVFLLTFTRLAQAVAAGFDGALMAATGLPLAWLGTQEGVLGATVGATLLCWLAIFGWVSRRAERQADAFAVRHLATERDEPWRDPAGRVVVDAESADTMIAALDQVAELNHVPRKKRSWRHGSIAWRQQNVRNLIGCPVDAMPIDSHMQRIKLAALAAIVVMALAYGLIS